MKTKNDTVLKVKIDSSLRFNLTKLDIVKITLLLEVVFKLVSYLF